jgi:hypothetical protein
LVQRGDWDGVTQLAQSLRRILFDALDSNQVDRDS